MNALKIVFLIVIVVLLSPRLTAQIKRQISGSVKDSTTQAVPTAYVRLIAGKDTLNASTDDKGKFLFGGISSQQVSLQIKSIGYSEYNTSVIFEEKQKKLELAPISCI